MVNLSWKIVTKVYNEFMKLCTILRWIYKILKAFFLNYVIELTRLTRNSGRVMTTIIDWILQGVHLTLLLSFILVQSSVEKVVWSSMTIQLHFFLVMKILNCKWPAPRISKLKISQEAGCYLHLNLTWVTWEN